MKLTVIFNAIIISSTAIAEASAQGLKREDNIPSFDNGRRLYNRSFLSSLQNLFSGLGSSSSNSVSSQSSTTTASSYMIGSTSSPDTYSSSEASTKLSVTTSSSTGKVGFNLFNLGNSTEVSSTSTSGSESVINALTSTEATSSVTSLPSSASDDDEIYCDDEDDDDYSTLIGFSLGLKIASQTQTSSSIGHTGNDATVTSKSASTSSLSESSYDLEDETYCDDTTSENDKSQSKTRSQPALTSESFITLVSSLETASISDNDDETYCDDATTDGEIITSAEDSAVTGVTSYFSSGKETKVPESDSEEELYCDEVTSDIPGSIPSATSDKIISTTTKVPDTSDDDETYCEEDTSDAVGITTTDKITYTKGGSTVTAIATVTTNVNPQEQNSKSSASEILTTVKKTETYKSGTQIITKTAIFTSTIAGPSSSTDDEEEEYCEEGEEEVITDVITITTTDGNRVYTTTETITYTIFGDYKSANGGGGTLETSSPEGSSSWSELDSSDDEGDDDEDCDPSCSCEEEPLSVAASTIEGTTVAAILVSPSLVTTTVTKTVVGSEEDCTPATVYVTVSDDIKVANQNMSNYLVSTYVNVADSTGYSNLLMLCITFFLSVAIF